MPPATKHGISFEPTFNLNTVITIIGLMVAGLVPFFSLKGDVGVIAANQRSVADSLTTYQMNQLAVSNKLTSDVAAIQQLIITRSADRYTKQDAQRDQDIVRDHFIAIENRLMTVENRGIERDKQLDQLNRTLGDISGALKAVRPAPR